MSELSALSEPNLGNFNENRIPTFPFAFPACGEIATSPSTTDRSSLSLALILSLAPAIVPPYSMHSWLSQSRSSFLFPRIFAVGRTSSLVERSSQREDSKLILDTPRTAELSRTPAWIPWHPDSSPIPRILNGLTMDTRLPCPAPTSTEK